MNGCDLSKIICVVVRLSFLCSVYILLSTSLWASERVWVSFLSNWGFCFPRCSTIKLRNFAWDWIIPVVNLVGAWNGTIELVFISGNSNLCPVLGVVALPPHFLAIPPSQKFRKAFLCNFCSFFSSSEGSYWTLFFRHTTSVKNFTRKLHKKLAKFFY